MNEFTQWQIQVLKNQSSISSACDIIHDLLAQRTQMIDAIIQFWFDCDVEKGAKDKVQLTVLAIGGYGRLQLSLYSDIDLLVLHEKPDVSHAEANEISLLTQLLWDIGLIPSIQTASFDAFVTLMQSDLSIATSILSARTLVGNPELSHKLVRIMQSDGLWSTETFIKGKLEDQQNRHAHYHSTSYHLEPDIKQNIGGLRDLHLIYWFVRKCYVECISVADLFKRAVISEKEYQLIEGSEKILLLYRFALHALLQRQDDRLLFTHQLTLVESFPFFQNSDLQSPTTARTTTVHQVEAMMKRLYQTMASISIQTRIIYEIVSEPLKDSLTYEKYDELQGGFILKAYVPVGEAAGCTPLDTLKQKQLTLSLKEQHQFTSDNLMLFFYYLAELEIPFEQIEINTLRALNQVHTEFPEQLVHSLKARTDFVRILMHPNATRYALRPLHKLSILWHYMPSWTHIIGLMQFDRFHAYTVDEHTFQVLSQIELMKLPTRQDLASILYHKQSQPAILTLAGLFHDVAKGLGGDHAIKGKRLFEDFAKQHELDLTVTKTVGWLIEHHLLLSITAQRRDLSDPTIISNFAKEVATQEQLDLLYILTVADIQGTNQTLWSHWKQSLLEQLYHLTKVHLAKSNLFQSNWRQLIKQNKQDAMQLVITRIMKQSHMDTVDPRDLDCSLVSHYFLELLEVFWKRCRIDYLMYHKPEQLAWHAQKLLFQEQTMQLDPCQKNRDIVALALPDAAIHATNQFAHGGTELFVWCQDRQNLFVAIVSLMDRRNISVLHAQIFTNRDNMAMDSFVIAERTGKPLSIARQTLIKNELQVLVSQNELLVTKVKLKRQSEHFFQHKTEIKFIASDNTSRTYIEINALDRPGLLFTIANVFAKFSLNLLGARITTIGERVEDMFIVTTSQRTALDHALKASLKAQLQTEIELL